VYCYDKKQRKIPDRVHGNQPKDILFRRNYYTDALGNIDADVYKPIEDAFAPHLLAMTQDVHAAVKRPGILRALREWVAAQLTRTQQVELIIRAYAKRFNRPDYLKELEQGQGILNSTRFDFFERILADLERCSWRMYWADANERRRFVLGDEPAIETPEAWATGRMYLVPLSARILLAGGSERGHHAIRDARRNIIPGGINGLAASHAHRFIYSGNLRELEFIDSMFMISGDPEHDDWMKFAREPNFGLQLMLDEATDEEIAQFFKTGVLGLATTMTDPADAEDPQSESESPPRES